MWFVLLSAALGAEVTSIPHGMGGKAVVRYDFSRSTYQLNQGDTAISPLTAMSHRVALEGEFAPTNGLAITTKLGFSPGWSHKWTGATQMSLEPLDGSGSFLAGGEESDVTIKGSGISDIWIGAALAPFHENYRTAHRSSWRVDVAFRLPSTGASKFTGPDEKRGASQGPGTLSLQGAFSSNQDRVEPYVVGGFYKPLKGSITSTDAAGEEITALAVVGPTVGSMAGGAEIVLLKDDSTKERVAVLFELGANYTGWSDQVSGYYLPNVLKPGRTIPMTTSDHIEVSAHTGLHIDKSSLTSSIRAGASWSTPFRVEHLYDVSTTTNNLTISVSVEVGARGEKKPQKASSTQ